MTHCFPLAALAMLATASAASAQLVVLNDNFDAYSAGNLVGQGGWTQTGATATNPIQVAGGPNFYAQLGTTGQDVYKAFTGPVAAVAGESLLSEFDITVSAAQTAGDYFFHISDPVGTTGNFYQRVFARSSTNGFQLGLIELAGGGAVTTWGTTELALGTTYSIAVTWNFIAGPNNDTFNLSVNGSSYLTHAWTSTTVEPANLSAANLRQGTSTSAPTLQIDNITVTSVPAPGAAALLGLGGLVALRRRR